MHLPVPVSFSSPSSLGEVLAKGGVVDKGNGALVVTRLGTVVRGDELSFPEPPCAYTFEEILVEEENEDEGGGDEEEDDDGVEAAEAEAEAGPGLGVRGVGAKGGVVDLGTKPEERAASMAHSEGYLTR